MAGGPYLHEAALRDAYKKLYMLGNRPPSKQTKSAGEYGDGFGGALSGGLSVARKLSGKSRMSKAEEDAKIRQMQAISAKRKAAAAADADQMVSDVAFIRGGDQHRDIVEGRAVPPSNPYAEALARTELDEAAENARIAGQFTKRGLGNSVQEATAMGYDLNLGKRLLGMAATIPGQTVTTPPEDQMRNYRRPMPVDPGY